jgi:hypothetical protein
MFKHEEISAATQIAMVSHRQPQVTNITHCFIGSRPVGADPKDSKTVGAGAARCSVKDKFMPEIGRVVALKRALITAFGEKPDKRHELAIKCYMQRPRKYKLQIPECYKLTFNEKKPAVPVEIITLDEMVDQIMEHPVH